MDHYPRLSPQSDRFVIYIKSSEISLACIIISTPASFDICGLKVKIRDLYQKELKKDLFLFKDFPSIS